MMLKKIYNAPDRLGYSLARRLPLRVLVALCATLVVASLFGAGFLIGKGEVIIGVILLLWSGQMVAVFTNAILAGIETAMENVIRDTPFSESGNDQLKDALRFYADDATWTIQHDTAPAYWDRGKKARTALDVK